MSSSNSPSDKQTVIEQGSEFKGSLNSSCPVDVRGSIDGDVSTPALTVGITGKVRGSAKVGSLRSQGEVAGTIEAETVELAGTVRDETLVKARTLDVKLASPESPAHVVFDDCELEIGDVKKEGGRGNGGSGKKRRRATKVMDPEDPPSEPEPETPPE